MPMPTMAMAAMDTAMAVTALAMVVDMAATAMAAMDTAMATATARGPLRPSPTTARAATAATATVDTDTESKKSKSISCNNTKNPTPNYLKLTYLNGQENYGCVSFKQR